ncbi:hypothetical protein T484DRAFT_1772474 [Baffinella frigidus]|nr:hypothetical protein T484DRAFT_1772474 [Cryptophyta sp. CCMP2293]
MTLSDESDEETASLLNNLLGLKNPAPTDEPDWLSSVAPNVSPSKMAFSAARSSRRAPTGSPARPTSNPVVTPEDSPARSRSGTGTMRGKGGKAAARRGGASGSGSEINWDVSQRKLHEGFKRVSVSKEEKEARVFDTLSLADLFAPLLSGSRLMGRAKVTAAAVAAAPPELEVRLEDEWGNAITGGNGKRAHLCLRFDGGVEGTLCVTVVRAVNLPRLDRFASSDPQYPV